MSGHSKWSTIKRAKGVADVKRGMTFTKLANTITLATKLGGSGNPDDNPRLRVEIDAARALNMPKDNIQRAIDRGLGKLAGQTVEEVVYEGFGPERVAFLIEGITDNKNRTTAEIKNIFDRNGGVVGNQGSVAYMFDKKGEIRVVSKGGNNQDEVLELIDLGAEDVEEYVDEGIKKYSVFTSPTSITKIAEAIIQSGFKVESSVIIFAPTITVAISNTESAQKVLDFAAKLEDHDDIQNVFANFDIPENLIQQES